MTSTTKFEEATEKARKAKRELGILWCGLIFTIIVLAIAVGGKYDSSRATRNAEERTHRVSSSTVVCTREVGSHRDIEAGEELPEMGF